MKREGFAGPRSVSSDAAARPDLSDVVLQTSGDLKPREEEPSEFLLGARVFVCLAYVAVVLWSYACHDTTLCNALDASGNGDERAEKLSIARALQEPRIFDHCDGVMHRMQASGLMEAGTSICPPPS